MPASKRRPLPLVASPAGPWPPPVLSPAKSSATLFLLLTLLLFCVTQPATAQTLPTQTTRPPAPPAAPQAPPGTTRYNSKSYIIYSDLIERDVRVFGKHMDATFAEYLQRFKNAGLRGRDTGLMPLFLFRQKDDYLAFLAKNGINAANTSGIFFVQEKGQGLAAYIQDRALSETISVLQHEGFHQFAWTYLGPGLPTWVNEGIAQYFEDGIVTRGGMTLNLGNWQRILSVKKALADKRTFPFRKLVQMSNDDWNKARLEGPSRVGLLYDQSWSMVFFLITADGGRYRPAFESYLKLLAADQDNEVAFARAFDSVQIGALELAWAQFASQQQPDHLNLTMIRLEFLANGLKFLADNRRTPTTIAQLRHDLQAAGFRLTQTTHGVEMTLSAKDDDLYRYPMADGPPPWFDLLPADRPGLPPRISATKLRPQPTLIWFSNSDGPPRHDLLWQ